MKRALVTGAAGFIGRAVTARLIADGWQVVGLVRKVDAPLPFSTIALGLAPWTVDALSNAISTVAPDIVFHIAGTVSAASVAEFYASNVALTATLLDAVSKAAVPAAVVLIGSAAEYGYLPPEFLPAREDGPCHPVTHYGISKLAQTWMGMAQARAGARVLIGRIFNPVGVGMPSNMALASFSQQLRQGARRLTVGDLDVARDFIDVEEAARLVVALASNSRNYGSIYNICSGTAVNLGNLVEQLIALTGRDVRLVIDPALVRPGEPREFWGDVSRLNQAGLTVSPPTFASLLARLMALPGTALP
ncbi:MAG TPA: NAD-dependent epimerase/dehydratase family protein [Acetobacteraceae bacterium]|nr:NAD-dependent epimerase/dehydratase family protein [Acetobacteraceae bacterium]